MQEASISMPASQSALEDASPEEVGPHAEGASSEKTQRSRNEDSTVLKLKGLPYTTVEQQITDFFDGYAVKQVSFVYDPDGRPSGLAFVDFHSKEEALRAMAKNGEYIGERYVRLLHVPRSEMEEQVRLGTLAVPGGAAKYRQRLLRSAGNYPPMPQQPAMMRPMGMAGRPQRPGRGYPPMGPEGMGGVPMPPGMPPHLPLMYQMQALSLGGGMQGGPYGGPAAAAAAAAAAGLPHNGAGPGGPGMPPAGAGGHNRGPGPNGNGGPGSHGPQGMHMGPPQHMGYPPLHGGPQHPMGPMMPPASISTASKTIKIRGLPFRASPVEIFSFFESFSYLADSLQLGVDAMGRPSGEAWLTFGSADEALRAVRELNRHYLGSRYLELSLL